MNVQENCLLQNPVHKIIERLKSKTNNKIAPFYIKKGGSHLRTTFRNYTVYENYYLACCATEKAFFNVNETLTIKYETNIYKCNLIYKIKFTKLHLFLCKKTK